jgi:hypothetical protein
MRWAVASVLALALLVPSAAGAQTPPQLPVGQAKGVRLVVAHDSIVLVFSHRSAKMRKRINSRYAWIDCTELPEGRGIVFVGSSGGNLDAPRRGRTVDTGIDPGEADYCRVFLRAHRKGHHHVGRRLLVSLSLTQPGAVFLDEEAGTLRLIEAELLAAVVEDKLKLSGYPTYAQIVQVYPKVGRLMVGLAAPGDAPPPKRVGYYSDGKEHIAVATLSTLGKRLFIEGAAGNVLSTNVADHLFDNWLF